jgi:hypothetical protein
VTPSWRRCGGPLLLGAALAGLATPVAAQDLLAKAPPQSAPIVLKNCKLFTVSGGIVLDGTLWFADGQIRGVLAADQTLQLPPGPEPVVLDLQGKLVFPGMISASTSLGLIEIGSVRQTVDTDEVGDLSPEALAIVAVNPDSTAIPVARSNGVLAAAVFPSGGLLPGRASVLQLDGWTNADLTVRADAGPVVAWPAERSRPRSRRGNASTTRSPRRGPGSTRSASTVRSASICGTRPWRRPCAARPRCSCSPTNSSRSSPRCCGPLRANCCR